MQNENIFTKKFSVIPKSINDNPTHKKIFVFSLVALVIVIMTVMSSVGGSSSSTSQPSVAIEMAFDVPFLLGKSLVDLEATLGTPSYDVEPTQQQLALGTDTWEKSWDSGEYSLMATYDIKTREVIDLFFGADSDAAFKLFEDTRNILAVGNLSTSDPKYSVEFVKAMNAPGYTGVIVRIK